MNLINRSSDYELYDLAKKMGLKKLIICSREDLKKYLKNKNINNIIFNLGNNTHWVYYNKKKKLYFDSYAMSIPIELPRNTKNTSLNFQVQSLEATDCGQLCLLAAYYSNFKSMKEFYKLFKDVY